MASTVLEHEVSNAFEIDFLHGNVSGNSELGGDISLTLGMIFDLV